MTGLIITHATVYLTMFYNRGQPWFRAYTDNSSYIFVFIYISCTLWRTSIAPSDNSTAMTSQKYSWFKMNLVLLLIHSVFRNRRAFCCAKTRGANFHSKRAKLGATSCQLCHYRKCVNPCHWPQRVRFLFNPKYWYCINTSKKERKKERKWHLTHMRFPGFI